jgi:hypothetical protein
LNVFRLIASILLTVFFGLLSATAWYSWHTYGGGYAGGFVALVATFATVGWYRCFLLDYQQVTEN